MTSAWLPEHLGTLTAGDAHRVPPVDPSVDRTRHPRLRSDTVYWDMWPIQAPDGSIADCAGRELWMALTAPDRGDPALRHFEAKIRLIERSGGYWIDRGAVLPDEPQPYEREWAGSALLDGTDVHLFFTAAGVADRPGGYQQRLYEAKATLGADGFPAGWSQPRPCLASDHSAYQLADAHEGRAGEIKAFRDPAFFRDPADGSEYLIFTASLADAKSQFNGAVGIAKRQAGGWDLLPPLLQADGVNNELERAHTVFHDGRYYLFWATQRSTFAPGLRHAPNGLYGMVADSLFGEYRPLNESGLVLANPEANPAQTYSWFVSRELVVSGFVDMVVERSDGADTARFGGVPAPLLQLSIDGDACKLEGIVAV